MGSRIYLVSQRDCGLLCSGCSWLLCAFQDDGLTFLSPSRISAGYVHAHRLPHPRLSVEYSLSERKSSGTSCVSIAPIFEPGTKQDCPRTFASEWEQLIACRYSSVILRSIQFNWLSRSIDKRSYRPCLPTRIGSGALSFVRISLQHPTLNGSADRNKKVENFYLPVPGTTVISIRNRQKPIRFLPTLHHSYNKNERRGNQK